MTSQSSFNEAEFIRLLFLLSDTQQWMMQMNNSLMAQVPVPGKQRLFKKSFFLSVPAFAHIIERHYYKINRYPGSGKFTIDIPQVLYWIKESIDILPKPQAGTTNFYRQLETNCQIGF